MFSLNLSRRRRNSPFELSSAKTHTWKRSSFRVYRALEAQLAQWIPPQLNPGEDAKTMMMARSSSQRQLELPD
ncbi:hypothetical protein U1Q18_050695 [Sarracenia purpurea var. burkii]